MKTILSVKLDLDLSGEAIIKSVGGRLWVSVPKECNVVVEYRDAGIKGVIGPNLLCDTKYMVEKMMEPYTKNPLNKG